MNKGTPEQRDTLLHLLTEAKSLMTIWRGSSPSNMTRYYDVYAITDDAQPLRLTGYICDLFGYGYDRHRQAMKVQGYGFSATTDILDTLELFRGAALPRCYDL